MQLCQLIYLTTIFIYVAADVRVRSGVKLGLIADHNSVDLSIVFQLAITEAADESNIKLEGTLENVNYGDSITAYGLLCNLLQNGVGAVFGPSSRYTADHLLAVCDTKDMPFIYPHMRDNSDGINLHPHPMDLAKALHAIIKEFQWSRFIFLYESSDYLSILNGLMSFYTSNNSPVVSVLRYDLKLNGNYKSVLRRVRKSEDGQILVVGSTRSVAELLKQAQQVGLMTEDYKYIIGNLDLQTFELEEYRYSEVNITGLRMFSPEDERVKAIMKELHAEKINKQNGSCSVTVEMALTYDAVQLFAETTKYINYHPQSLNCSENDYEIQELGSTFKNYMRSIEISKNTITGKIYFEGHVRKGYTFDVIELQPTGIVKIGNWDEHKNFTLERPLISNIPIDIVEDSLVNKTFTVLISVPNKPHASLIESHKRLDGNNQYEGYSIDLIKELADVLKFNFTFVNGGNDYGSFNKTTNVTTGMLKEIVDGRADLAITDLTITSEREEALDFSIPFMNLGIAILYSKPTKAEPKTFSFMDPFSSEVWVYLFFSFCGVTLGFFVLGRLSPTEWDNPYPCIEEPEELENQFNFSNSMWFTTGAFLQQGTEVAPKALSTRTLAAIWWFFTLIMVSSYTANLAAFLTIESQTSSINDVKDLAENVNGIQYGAKRTGSTRNFFLTSADPTYEKMNKYMTDHPELLTESNQEGVARVKGSADKNYAFLMESTAIEYNIMRECELMKVGEPLDEKGYGIAMPKNWPYRDKFNHALLMLQEQGVLEKLKNKWWNEIGAGVCNAKPDNSDVKPLSMKNVLGVYLVLGVGTAVSIIYSLAAWCIFVFRKARAFEVPFVAALREECRTAVDLSNYERILKSPMSVYSRSRNSLTSIDSIQTDSDQPNIPNENDSDY